MFGTSMSSKDQRIATMARLGLLAASGVEAATGNSWAIPWTMNIGEVALTGHDLKAGFAENVVERAMKYNSNLESYIKHMYGEEAFNRIIGDLEE